MIDNNNFVNANEQTPINRTNSNPYSIDKKQTISIKEQQLLKEQYFTKKFENSGNKNDEFVQKPYNNFNSNAFQAKGIDFFQNEVNSRRNSESGSRKPSRDEENIPFQE